MSPTVPPAWRATRWSSTPKLTKYHAKHLDLYKDFFDAERRICDTSYLENLTDFFHKEPELRRLRTELTFLAEHSDAMISLIDFLQVKNNPTAHVVYDLLYSFGAELESGCSKITFGLKTETIFKLLPDQELAAALELFHSGYRKAYQKYQHHFCKQEKALEFFKAAGIFDPRQRSTLSHYIKSFEAIPDFKYTSNALIDE